MLPPKHRQGPSPLPRGNGATGTTGGPKPPGSACPAPGRRFTPTGSGAALRGLGL